MTLPGARCTGGGDIFHKKHSGLITGCKLYCRSTFLSFPSDCAWRPDNYEKNSNIDNNNNNNNNRGQEFSKTEIIMEIPEWQQHSILDVILLTISNFFWLPTLIYCFKRRVFIEPIVILFLITFVSLFHQCKEGLICFLPYDILYFLDSFLGLAGVFIAFIQSAAIRNRYAQVFAYSLLVFLASLTGYISVIHQDPQEMVLVVTTSLLLGLSLVIIRYCLLDRHHRPNFNGQRLTCAWLLVLLGMVLTRFQYLYHYPYVHSLWHCLAAFSGYLSITATQPAGCYPTWPKTWPWLINNTVEEENYKTTHNKSNGIHKPSRKIV